LLARILAARGDLGETRTLLTEISRNEIGDDNRVIVGVLQCCFAADAPDAWSVWLSRADAVLSEDVRLELASLAQRNHALPSEKLSDVRALASRHPVWSRRHAF